MHLQGGRGGGAWCGYDELDCGGDVLVTHTSSTFMYWPLIRSHLLSLPTLCSNDLGKLVALP